MLLVVPQQETRTVHGLAPLAAAAVQVALDQVRRRRQVRRAAAAAAGAQERQVGRRLRGVGRRRRGRRPRRRRGLQQGVLQRVLRREEGRRARAADEVRLQLVEVGAVQRGRTQGA